MSISAISNTLITSRPFPQDIGLLTRELNKMYTEISQVVNFKTNGIYELTQTNTSNSWFSTGNIQDKRQSFRTVYTVDALANTGTVTIPLGFTVISATTFVNIYGTAESDTISTPLTPWIMGTPNDAPYLRIDRAASQINIITTTGNWTGFSAIVILEYLLN